MESSRWNTKGDTKYVKWSNRFFELTPVEFELESLDGKVKRSI